MENKWSTGTRLHQDLETPLACRVVRIGKSWKTVQWMRLNYGLLVSGSESVWMPDGYFPSWVYGPLAEPWSGVRLRCRLTIYIHGLRFVLAIRCTAEVLVGYLWTWVEVRPCGLLYGWAVGWLFTAMGWDSSPRSGVQLRCWLTIYENKLRSVPMVRCTAEIPVGYLRTWDEVRPCGPVYGWGADWLFTDMGWGSSPWSNIRLRCRLTIYGHYSRLFPWFGVQMKYWSVVCVNFRGGSPKGRMVVEYIEYVLGHPGSQVGWVSVRLHFGWGVW